MSKYRRQRTGIFTLVFVSVAICLHISCAAPRRLMTPPDLPGFDIETVEDALMVLRKNYQGIDSMKADGEITMQFPDGKGPRKAFFALFIERPDKLRMRAYRRLLPTLFELVSDGRECWIYVPSQKIAYLNVGCGSFYIGEEERELSPNAVATSILVIADFDAFSSLPMSIELDNDLVKISILEESDASRELWINRETGLAERQVVYDSTKLILAEIVYKEHASNGDKAVPVEMDILFPQIQAEVSIAIKNYLSSVHIPAEIFTFRPPPGTDTKSLKASHAESF